MLKEMSLAHLHQQLRQLHLSLTAHHNHYRYVISTPVIEIDVSERTYLFGGEEVEVSLQIGRRRRETAVDAEILGGHNGFGERFSRDGLKWEKCEASVAPGFIYQGASREVMVVTIGPRSRFWVTWRCNAVRIRYANGYVHGPVTAYPDSNDFYQSIYTL